MATPVQSTCKTTAG